MNNELRTPEALKAYLALCEYAFNIGCDFELDVEVRRSAYTSDDHIAIRLHHVSESGECESLAFEYPTNADQLRDAFEKVKQAHKDFLGV